MEATGFKEETHVLGPPPGMGEEEVHSLSVGAVDYGGQPAIVSCWKVTKEELELLQKTGKIWITCMGTGLQPLVPSVNSPYDFDDVHKIDVDTT